MEAISPSSRPVWHEPDLPDGCVGKTYFVCSDATDGEVALWDLPPEKEKVVLGFVWSARVILH